MAQIVDARSVMRPAVAPAQLLTQRGKDAMDLMAIHVEAESSPASADEERRILLCEVAGEIANP